MNEQQNLTQCCSGLLFLNIFKTFQIAIQPARFFTAFLAIAIIFIVGWLMDINKTVVVSGQFTENQLKTSMLTSSAGWPTELHYFVADSQRTKDFIERNNQNPRRGVFEVWSNFCLARFNQAAVSLVLLNFSNFAISVTETVAACIWALRYHTIYSVIFLLIAMVVLSITGGAICRGAALQFSKNERPGIVQCLRFALKKFISLFCAPLAPIILVIILGLIILVFGLLANIPWAGEIILAVFFIIVLAAGLFMTFAVVGSFAGVNFMYSAIAYENSDAFDSVSRSLRYVYSQPWRLGFYALLAAVYGSITYLFVRFFAFILLLISRWFLAVVIWTKGAKAEQLNKLDVLWPRPQFLNLLPGGPDISKNVTELIAAFVINLETLIIAGLVVAFAVSFYFSASTIIYSLLRNKVDNTAVTNVFIESQQAVGPDETQNSQQPQ